MQHWRVIEIAETETTTTCWKSCSAAIWLDLLLLPCTFKTIRCLMHLSLSVPTCASSSNKYSALDCRMEEQHQYLWNSVQLFPTIYTGASPAQKNLACQASQLKNRTLFVGIRVHLAVMSEFRGNQNCTKAATHHANHNQQNLSQHLLSPKKLSVDEVNTPTVWY